ncbi:MAG: hypothetical protein K2F63_01110, partial [Muribaculaceae bacterium]|nr:hypothetical protein [Muribaculaceae bacterium]
SPWAERLSVVNSSFSEFVPEEKCSLIISNPPYFSNGATAPDPSRAVARHQSELSYATLASYAGRHLAADGFLGLVAPSELEDSILFDASLAGLHLTRLCRVRTSPSKAPTRILMEFSRKPSTPHVADLSLHSDEYKGLVGDLYTKI